MISKCDFITFCPRIKSQVCRVSNRKKKERETIQLNSFKQLSMNVCSTLPFLFSSSFFFSFYFLFAFFSFFILSFSLSRLPFRFMIKIHTQNRVCIADQMLECVHKKDCVTNRAAFSIVYLRMKNARSYKRDRIELENRFHNIHSDQMLLTTWRSIHDIISFNNYFIIQIIGR